MTNQIPDFPNFYSVNYNFKRDTIVKILENNGWKIRKSSWTEYECANDWIELIISGDEENNVLLNGSIIYNLKNLKIIDDYLNDFNANYQYEFYDEDKKIVIERKKKN